MLTVAEARSGSRPYGWIALPARFKGTVAAAEVAPEEAWEAIVGARRRIRSFRSRLRVIES